MGREKSNQVNVRTEPNNFLQQAFCHSQESYLEVPQYKNWRPDYTPALLTGYRDNRHRLPKLPRPEKNSGDRG